MIMAKAATIGFKDFRVRYNTEDACRAELFRFRFPDGVVCLAWSYHLWPQYLPVPCPSAPNLRHCWYCYAPHQIATNCLVPGYLSLRYRQVWNICGSVKPHSGNPLWFCLTFTWQSPYRNGPERSKLPALQELFWWQSIQCYAPVSFGIS